MTNILTAQSKKNILFIFISYFFVLFTYPFIRAAATSYFIQSYGGAATPKAWLAAVIALSGAIFISNRIQNKLGVQSLFAWVCFVSLAIFGSSLYFYLTNLKIFSYFFFVWKEVYIVILVHLILAYCNTIFTLEEMKKIYGPIGACGSIGGIVGGLLTSYLSKKYGVNSLFVLTGFGLMANAFFFSRTLKEVSLEKEEEKITPLESIKDIKQYVLLIACIVALSQFVINIANLQFNLLFTEAVALASEKASYIGQIFAAINGVTLFFQVLIIPYFFVKIDNKKIQAAVPLIYIALSIFGLGFGAGSILLVGGAFIAFKSFDYSIFTVSKEILYHSLKNKQKYGAKYIVDMVVYRAAKAAIAVVLIGVQNITALRIMTGVFLGLWLICLKKLFSLQQNK
jgi:AAA family ATP:ADP antiporter